VSNAPGDAGRPDPEQLFKKYWRGAGATRHAGSGLGLYLSSLIARRLGGELRYQPEMTDVRFVLWLPI
jgi:signal transduction histidine kinase